MASPMMQTVNDENGKPIAAEAKTITTAGMTLSPPRRALGIVSPNIKSTSPAFNTLQAKPMTSNPLKRSLTAMMNDGVGFTYLKKRKLSSHDDGVVEQTRARPQAHLDLGVVSFIPLLPEARDDKDVPAIQELSPTEPNTPLGSEEEGTQESSAERKSFSSLINYDPSSQTSNPVFRPTRAETLKLRLRIAMYKVRTNQIDVRFADLEKQAETAKSTSTSTAVDEAVALLRREAQQASAPIMQPQQPRAVSKLLPAPVLKPTAYSSRVIYEPQLPSSPPATRSPERQALAAQISTPQQSVRQLSSPPNSAEGVPRHEDTELTSSVVKGRVAEGLLDLRHAV